MQQRSTFVRSIRPTEVPYHWVYLAGALRHRNPFAVAEITSMTATDTARYRIAVHAVSTFLAEQSDPAADLFTFAYTVTIENLGTEPAQLLSRHWVVTDANGETQEVRGAGVVGEQPHLRPGESYRYSSGTQIPTPVGSMHGSYLMRADDGTRFEAEIPAFSLSSHTHLH
jgi:ApaG protein